MSVKKSLIKNTGFNLAGYVYLLLASFFSISILLKNLGSELFGIYLFLGSFVPLVSVFDFGISTAAVRSFSLPETSKEDRIRTWQTSFFLYLFMALMLFVVVGAVLLTLTSTMPLFDRVDRNSLYTTILILCITIFVNHINSHFLNLPQAEQRFDIFNSKTLLVGSANTIVSAAISASFPDLSIIFLVQLVFHLLTTLYMLWYCLRIFPLPFFLPRYDKKTGKELLVFGIKNFIGVLASQLEAQISKFALGAQATASAITAFSIPQNIVAKGAGVVSQFAQAFFPLSASLLAKERIKKLRNLVVIVQVITLMGGIVAVLLTYTIGESFLMWWLHNGDVVAQALPVLKILSVYFILVALTPVPTALVQSMGRPQVASFFAVLTVSLEALLMLILVPQYQAVGAAYAFLGSSVVSVPAFLIVSWRMLNQEIEKIAV